jgi:hypothetical protein
MEVIMLLKKDLKWSPDGIQITTFPPVNMRLAHFLNVLLRLLPRWGFSTGLNSLKLKHQLSLKPAISGVRENEALCRRATLPVPYRQR